MNKKIWHIRPLSKIEHQLIDGGVVVSVNDEMVMEVSSADLCHFGRPITDSTPKSLQILTLMEYKEK